MGLDAVGVGTRVRLQLVIHGHVWAFNRNGDRGYGQRHPSMQGRHHATMALGLVQMPFVVIVGGRNVEHTIATARNWYSAWRQHPRSAMSS